MLAQKTRRQHDKQQKHSPIGYCLGCKSELSRCAVPFSAELLCRKCNVINVYKDSQQPVGMREQAIATSTKLAYSSGHDQEHVPHPERPEDRSE